MAPVNFQPGSFGYDLHFLEQHDSGLVVLQSNDARVIVSPKYQGKVFTSTAAGEEGPSFGWIHYKAFDGPLDPHMNAYGGENRLWLGPEGGPFSLFFAKGESMEFSGWHTPAAFDSEPWDLNDSLQNGSVHNGSRQNSSPTSVSLRKDIELTNYAGTRLRCRVDRKISLLDVEAINNLLRTQVPKDVKIVAYRTENTLTNTGVSEWTDSTGMPCMWLLDMFPPSQHTTIVIPYTKGNPLPATTDYFGPISGDRLKYQDSVLLFKADGKLRGKLGIHPDRTKPIAGSYDAISHILTIILFDRDPIGRYLNQQWRTDLQPFSGDAMNAYNDGPLADGSQMGPFYELESVSSAAFLPPGHSMTHWHSVFHFTGDESALDKLARATLGISLDQIKTAFK